MADLSIEFCNIKFKNPLILPSGIAQNIPEDHLRVIAGGAGGMTTKSLTVEPREGNPLPRVLIVKVLDQNMGIMNSVGLRGPGLVAGIPKIKQLLKQSNIPVIVSIFASSIADFEKLATGLLEIHPQFLELNISCPNVIDEFGQPIGMGSKSSALAVKKVKKIIGKIPVLAKLTPNIPGISDIAKACEEAGADGITAINTVGPGMVIDIKSKKPVLGAFKGGISGPIIKSIAIRCVYEIYEAVRIPIIGMGGVSSWQDAVEMMMAGATLVGVGSSTYLKGMKLFGEIADQLLQYLKNEKIYNIKELIGKAHQNI